MISEHVKKRDNSFYITAMIVGLFGFAIFIAEYFFPYPDSDSVSILVTIWIVLIAIGNSFLFKGFYHWSKAKGYPGNYCLLEAISKKGFWFKFATGPSVKP